MSELVVSVIMPTFNQKDSLELTLQSFAYQNINHNIWELILIDDGSTDQTEDFIKKYSHLFYFNFFYIRTNHKGRATARNAGIRNSRGDIIIFNDSDRMVCNNFISEHINFFDKNKNELSIGLGDIWEVYSSDINSHKLMILSSMKTNFLELKKIARRPGYVKAVYQMFNEKDKCTYAVSWLAFLTGNISVRRAFLNKVQGFDEKFTEWGFEHFELGYRLLKNGADIQLVPEAKNYHLAHSRGPDFYGERIKKSYDYFITKHNNQDIIPLYDFLTGKLSLEEYHNLLSPNKISLGNNQTYYKQLKMQLTYSDQNNQY